jgi:hypothetical protein
MFSVLLAGASTRVYKSQHTMSGRRSGRRAHRQSPRRLSTSTVSNTRSSQLDPAWICLSSLYTKHMPPGRVASWFIRPILPSYDSAAPLSSNTPVHTDCRPGRRLMFAWASALELRVPWGCNANRLELLSSKDTVSGCNITLNCLFLGVLALVIVLYCLQSSDRGFEGQNLFYLGQSC